MPGQSWGKLAFMSPEQAQNRTLDRRTDIYTLGLVLWTMLTGQPVGTTVDGGRVIPPSADKEKLLEDILKRQPPPPSRLNPACRRTGRGGDTRPGQAPREPVCQRCDLAAALAPFASVVPSGDAILAELVQGSFDGKAERAERAELVAAAQRTLRTATAPADPSEPAPALMASAVVLPGTREGRRAPQAAGRAWHMVALAILGALLVAGFLFYDFLHLRRATNAPEPAEVLAPASSPAVAIPDAAPAVVPPPVAAGSFGKSYAISPRGPGRRCGDPAPRPEASPTERAALLEQAQAAFDEGNLDRAQSEARRAAALGNPEADALLGTSPSNVEI